MSNPSPFLIGAEGSLRTTADHRYLIIAGTTKGATTSLYQYLGAHPQVCISNIKETRFFLDKDYPVTGKFSLADGLESYDQFFSQCADSNLIRVDATPDYLYSPRTAENIRASLPNCKIVFALREPVARLISWYRFAKQNNTLAETISPDEYVASQLNAAAPGAEQHLRALEQGRYARYLKAYTDQFGAENIFITFLEALADDPRAVMRGLCAFAQIDPRLYDRYEFHVFNRTETIRSPALHQLYRRTRFSMINRFQSNTRLRIFFRKVRRSLEPIYLRLNRKPAPEQALFSAKTIAALKAYYQPANAELAALLGRSLPW
jgi:hypothetical protein